MPLQGQFKFVVWIFKNNILLRDNKELREPRQVPCTTLWLINLINMKIIQSLILVSLVCLVAHGQTLLIPSGESTGNSSSSGLVEVNGSNGSTNGKQFRVYFGGGGNLLNAEFQALTHLPGLLTGNAWTSLYANRGNARKAAVFNGDVSFFNGNIGLGIENPTSTLEVVGNTGGVNGRNFKITYAGGGSGLANTEFSALTHITHIPDVNGWTALYAKQGSAKKAGVFDGDVSVNGNIHTKEVKVDLNGWADFVFEKDYKLPTLEDVENYIIEHKHLPEIPNEAEVTERGVNLGEMNAKLLQKIEELTLYLIDINKQIQHLKSENEELKSEVNSLKSK